MSFSIRVLCLLSMMTLRGHKSLPLTSGQFLVGEQAMPTTTAITNLLDLSEIFANPFTSFSSEPQRFC